jgi:DNA-directed RNA polymerase subunit RPC12/RpoP
VSVYNRLRVENVMAKKSKVISVRFPDSLCELVAKSLEKQKADYPGVKQSATQWLLGAIREKLAREERDEKNYGPARYKCGTCNKRISQEQIMYSFTDLFGKKKHVCKSCSDLQN